MNHHLIKSFFDGTNEIKVPETREHEWNRRGSKQYRLLSNSSLYSARIIIQVFTNLLFSSYLNPIISLHSFTRISSQQFTQTQITLLLY